MTNQQRRVNKIIQKIIKLTLEIQLAEKEIRKLEKSFELKNAPKSKK